MADTNVLPEAALRVGVTGHRHLDTKLAEQLRPRIRAALAAVRPALEGVVAASGGAYAAGPVLLRAISPLAEGADRLFAEEALALGYKLACPLPFDPETYYETFEGGESGRKAAKIDPPTRESIEELRLAKAAGLQAFTELFEKRESAFVMDGVNRPGGAAYDAIGRVVLDQSDILVAIWNGQPAAGEGGTANILKLARRRRMPVLCLRTDAAPDVLFLHGNPNDGAPLSPELIGSVVKNLTMPPWRQDDSPESTGAYTTSQMGSPSFLGDVWAAFERLLTIGVKYPKPSGAPYSAAAVTDHFEAHYRAINEPAKRLAGLYRGAFLTSYAFGVLAVFLALLSYAAPDLREYWIWAELAVIVAVVIIARSIRQNRWHHCTVDCRYLAEQLRILRYIYPLGLSSPPARLPAHYVHSEQKSWMEWRLRAMIRQTPMPERILTAARLEESYADILNGWIAGQINYHERNKCRLELMEHRLHWLGLGSICIAFIGCIGHFFYHEPPIAPWLTLLAAGFPAAAAACHAISTQGEFKRLADRSDSMAQSLRSVSRELESLKNPGPLTGARLREEVDQVAQVMLEEVVDWQILYRKPAPPVG